MGQNVIEQILEKLPSDAKVGSHSYEGANIVLYTKNGSFFKHGGDIIRHVVDEVKKRIDLRADSSLRMPEEEAKKFVEKIMPKDAEVTNIFLESARSVITIEAKQPGNAIGKNGAILKEIKERTYWTPKVLRESVIPSKITQKIRSVLYQDSRARRLFLDKVGKRIYEEKKYHGKDNWVRASYLGAASQVGRSCILLQTPESKIVIDCGIDPASEKDPFPLLTAPEFDIQSIDAVIVSHAHLDHSGFIPYLFRYGYTGPVYCTAPTRDVSALLQLDYINVSHAKAQNAPYGSNDVQETVKNTITLDYGVVTDIAPDVRLTLYNAGHILGSSLVHLHIGEGWHNILYTGDYKCKQTQLLDGAHKHFPRVETLMTEATYGAQGDIMPSRQECEDELAKIILGTLKRGGKTLIPVLGVGRAQEVMLIVEELTRKHKLKVPVYIDGMVWDITAIHNMYPGFLNSDVRRRIFHEGKDPFLAPCFKQVGSAKERQQVLDGGPCVILATSGMLVGGPSVTYLSELAQDKKNSLVFVSYQGEGSLGAKIQRGERRFVVETNRGNKDVEMEMDSHTIPGLSGHSDKNELVSYVHLMKPTPRRIITMHGEKSKCLNLASTLHKTFNVETSAPRLLDAFRLR